MPGETESQRRRAATLDRRLTLGAAAALFASLFAPWYGWTVSAAAVSGTVHAHGTFTGWQAVSGAQVVAAVVAVAAAVVVATRSPARSMSGAIAAAGGLAAALVFVKLVSHPGTQSALAHRSVTVQWGLIVTLLAALAVCGLGVRMALRRPPAVRERPQPRPAPALAPRIGPTASRRRPRSLREPETVRPPAGSGESRGARELEHRD